MYINLYGRRAQRSFWREPFLKGRWFCLWGARELLTSSAVRRVHWAGLLWEGSPWTFWGASWADGEAYVTWAWVLRTYLENRNQTLPYTPFSPEPLIQRRSVSADVDGGETSESCWSRCRDFWGRAASGTSSWCRYLAWGLIAQGRTWDYVPSFASFFLSAFTYMISSCPHPTPGERTDKPRMPILGTRK